MDNPPENEQLEKYLDRLCYALFLMPEAEAAEVRQELHQHLLTMIAMHEAEGLSKPEAVRTALEGFGDPRQIGKGMMTAWFIKRDAMLGIERPRYAKIPDSVIRLYQTGSAVGLGLLLGCNLINPHFSRAAVIILIATEGSVVGLMEAAKTEPSQRRQEMLPPENATRWHRYKHNLARQAHDWLKRNFGKALALSSGQKLLPLDLGKLTVWLVLQGFVLAQIINDVGVTPLMIAFFVYMSAVWLAKEVARRMIYRTRRVR